MTLNTGGQTLVRLLLFCSPLLLTLLSSYHENLVLLFTVSITVFAFKVSNLRHHCNCLCLLFWLMSMSDLLFCLLSFFSLPACPIILFFYLFVVFFFFLSHCLFAAHLTALSIFGCFFLRLNMQDFYRDGI